MHLTPTSKEATGQFSLLEEGKPCGDCSSISHELGKPKRPGWVGQAWVMA